MSEMVRSSITNGVAVITIDNPPVNALSPGVPEGISTAIHEAGQDPAVSAIVIIGAGRTFIAGADIKQLEDHAHGRGSGAPNLHDLLKQIEDCPKPVVMALHGTALGGGLELAMAGHYGSRAPMRKSASRKSISASFRAPKARSGCRGSSVLRPPSTCWSRETGAGAGSVPAGHSRQNH